MMLIALAVLGWWLWHWARRQYRREGREFLWKGGLALAVFLCLVLAAAGKLNWLAAAGAGLLALSRMLLPTLLELAPRLLGQRGAVSELRTATVELRLHNASGAISGRVLSGPFAGSALDSLSPAELQQLIAHCQQHDPEAVAPLQAYAQRRQHRPSGGSGPMGRDEALAILGLSPGAAAEEIREAHRRLIQRMHPDRGGSEYLAARINQARDVLLG